MSLPDRGSRLASWLPAVGWLVGVVLLGVHVDAPALLLEAPTLAWGVSLFVVVFALTHYRARSPRGRRSRQPS